MLVVQVPVWCPRTAVSRGAPQEGLQWKQIFQSSKRFAVKTAPQNTKNIAKKKNFILGLHKQFCSETQTTTQTAGLPWSETKVLEYKHLWYRCCCTLLTATAHCTGAKPRKWGRAGQRTWGGRATHWCQPQWAGEKVKKYFVTSRTITISLWWCIWLDYMSENAISFKKVIVERAPPYMQKVGDTCDISPQFFLDFPQNFRLRTRNQYCTQAIAWGSTI